MSMMAAIDAALRLQMARDKTLGSADYQLPMGGAPAAGGGAATGYGYDANRLMQLLEQVSVRLRIDIPPLRYDWSRTDVNKALTGSLLSLIGLIACDTVAAGGDRP